MKKKIAVSVLFFALSFSTKISQAQTFLPNDIDLTAAYCVGVLNAKIDALNKESHLREFPAIRDSQDEQRQGFHRDLRRLNLYLMPRLSRLETQGLLAATVSGKEDFFAGLEDFTKCTGTKKNCVTDQGCYSACRSSSPAIRRTDRCNDTSFLPQ